MPRLLPAPAAVLLVALLAACTAGGGRTDVAQPVDPADISVTALPPAGAADAPGDEAVMPVAGGVEARQPAEGVDGAETGAAETGAAETGAAETGAAKSADADAAVPPSGIPEEAVPPVAEPPPPTPEALACGKKGGRYVGTGQGSLKACVRTTGEGTKRCTKETDCKGVCLARSGTCSPVTPLFGCNDILQADGRRVTLCIE